MEDQIIEEKTSKVEDIFHLGGRTFGYCQCGREVEYPKNSLHCPKCWAELMWGEDVAKTE